jgi:3-phosphoshikimate 1-carboxyvinyltransferase
MTNRAVILAALADGSSTLRAPLHSRDTELMTRGLSALGVDVTTTDDAWHVDGGAFTGDDSAVDVGNAGTVARFLPPVAALSAAAIAFDGDARIRERPLGPLVDALRALGVDIVDDGRRGLPLVVRGTGAVRGGEVSLDASSSSQLVSGLLLAGARYDDGVTVHHVGAPVPSMPHIDMTVAMLRDAGADVDDTTADTWHVARSTLRARTWDIEPDLSSAAPFLAAALVTSGTVHIAGWPASTTQPGAMLPDLFARMGARTQLADGMLTLVGPDRVLGIDADLHECGELAPVVAAAAVVASTPSRLRGIGHLRAHETDRLAALATEFTRLGGDVRETDDGLAIKPATLHGGTVATYDDHRLAMAAAVLGLVVPGVIVENVATTRKTMPDFAARWTAMLGAAD